MHYFSCVTTETLKVSKHIWYGHKDFFSNKSTNLFTIPKSDLFSTADDMKQGICIYSSTSLCEWYSYRKRHVFKVIAGLINHLVATTSRERGINLGSILHSQMECRPSCVPVCSMEPLPLSSMARVFAIWPHPALQRWILALPFQSLSVAESKRKKKVPERLLKISNFKFLF